MPAASPAPVPPLPRSTAPAHRRRAVRLAGVGLLSLAALAACTKPTPSVTVWSGTRSVHTEAICWETCTAEAVQQGLAATEAPGVAVIEGSTVGINVDAAIADAGWYPAIGTSKLTAAPITSTYYRFTFPAGQTFPAGGFPLEIVAVGQGSTPRGVWLFKLTNASG